jgi:hypothetical protein
MSTETSHARENLANQPPEGGYSHRPVLKELKLRTSVGNQAPVDG